MCANKRLWLTPMEGRWATLEGVRYKSRRRTWRERLLSVPWRPWVRYELERYDG